ncbi:MAG TPA: alpha/beta hydrolase [Candidatus Dormibacteraeota bacterium]|nr:alpha/beta hydrolase [Candidatus Dormibacteraeota bacterium]
MSAREPKLMEERKAIKPAPAAATQFLNLPGGRLAYDDIGTGPLIVATPAMLDLRSELRFLVPLLVRAGFRVVTLDQRGLGETSGEWPAYGSIPLADDLVALIRHLDAGPAIIYGTSNGAAAAVYVAAEYPELLRGIVLAAPFVRDGKLSWIQRRLTSVMRIPFLTLPIYMSYFPNWEPRRPRVPDFNEHVAKLKANLSEPSRRRVIREYLFHQTHREAEARLGKVRTPSLVIMGSADIDWPDPQAEAKWIVSRLGSQLLMLDGAGHHPHVEYPEEVANAVVNFARLLG